MGLNRFQVLKHKISEEPELAQVWLYFMDKFVDDPEFVHLGDETQDKFLEGVVPQICGQMFTKR